MAIFGRKTARERLRRASQQALSVPAFRSSMDCTPWVLGGLWPSDLQQVNADTAPLAEYLKKDLQRIADSANDRLRAISEAGLEESARQSEESRVINVARAFAVLRVESTVRQLRREPLGFAETLSLTGRTAPPPPPRPVAEPERRRPAEPERRPEPEPWREPEPRREAQHRRESEPEPISVSPEATGRHRVDREDFGRMPSWPETPRVIDADEIHDAVDGEVIEADDEPDGGPAPVVEAVVVEVEDAEPDVVEPEPEVVEPEPDVVEPEPEVVEPEPEVIESEPEVVELEPEVIEPEPTPRPLRAEPPDRVEPARPRPEVIDVPVARAEPTPPAPEPPKPEPARPDERTLQRVVRFVARQEPGLRWAAGVTEDGGVILATDLAHGWIPSGIDLPEGVKLPEPQRRTGNPASILGTVTAFASYAPGGSFGGFADREKTPVSIQPRRLEPIDDLDQKIADVTRQRDGLPRLTHALASAGASGAMINDAEVDVLRVHLDTARYQLMAQYPDVDNGLLLNCLLLAATESLVTGDRTAANYHFAWFGVLSGPPTARWGTGD